MNAKKPTFELSPVVINIKDGVPDLTAVLTSDRPDDRLYGRLIATGIDRTLREWIIAEVDRKSGDLNTTCTIASWLSGTVGMMMSMAPGLKKENRAKFLDDTLLPGIRASILGSAENYDADRVQLKKEGIL